MKYREIAAELIRRGENVALYCDGLFSDTNILYLDKFYGVKPAVVIDNDLRKKGTTLLDIPVMPYAEAKSAFPGLYYYIQGNTYQCSLIGSLLEDGVPPEHIVNYVPVEKRPGCMMAESTTGCFAGECVICFEAGFNYDKNNSRLHFDSPDVEQLERRYPMFRDHDGYFQADGTDCRASCPLYKSGYYAVEPKIRLMGNYTRDYCELACIYCFFNELIIGHVDTPSSVTFPQWLSVFLKSKLISDALVLHMCPTEKTVDEDTEKSLAICNENLDAFEAIHLFSCCYAYREGMEPLLAKGMAKVFWSLDAGTAETFEKIKRKKDSFARSLDNAIRYQQCDIFGGASIVPKYAIVRGINDNERDFDGFLEICRRLNVKYCALQWDYSDDDNTSEEDFEIIRALYRKIRAAGLKTTYTSGSTVLSKALNSLVFYEG